MKFLMAIGGCTAFVGVLGVGFFVGRDPVRAVMEAAIAAVLAALLCRWLYGFFARSVNAAMEEKRHARINEATAEAMKKAPSSAPKS